jgi:hypothetical protein
MALNSGGPTATSTVAAPIAAGPCTEVTVRNEDGAINMKVGNASAQNYTLGPGNAVKLRVTNRNLVWVKSASATPSYTWIST